MEMGGILTIIGFISVLIAFCGSFLVIKKNKYGMFLWLIANIIMIIVSYLQNNYWPLTFSCGNFLLTVYGIREWFK